MSPDEEAAEAAAQGGGDRYALGALVAVACLLVVWMVGGSVGAIDHPMVAVGPAPLCRPGLVPDCGGRPGCVYVLRLEDGAHYVGHTERPIAQRMREHFLGRKGSQWTTLHRPVCVESVAPGDMTDENRETLSRMCRDGVAGVRGGCWAGTAYVPRFDPCDPPPDVSFAAHCPWMH